MRETEVRRAELTEALAAILEGRTWTETRLLLEGRVERSGAEAISRFALNDIVIARGNERRRSCTRENSRVTLIGFGETFRYRAS